MPDVLCRSCNDLKPEAEFYLDKARGGVYPYCKLCQRQKSTARYHKVKSPELIRRRSLNRRYRITPEAYAAMLAAQGGVCAACGADPGKSSHGVLPVDHNHETGAVRGLLCSRCNSALSVVETPGLLDALLRYLERFDA